MLLILRIVLAIVVIRAIWMLIRGVLEGAGYHRGPTLPPAAQLVRDPVCGMYLPPARALTIRTGDATAYFCSEKCRAEWQRQPRAAGSGRSTHA